MNQLYKEIKVIGQNDNGVIYVESEKGTVFGIVDSLTITDEDGLIHQGDTLTVIENNFDCELEQDWENEITRIHTNYKSVIEFSGSSVVLKDYE